MGSILKKIYRLLILSALSSFVVTAAFAEESDYSLNLYGAKMTSNSWDEFFSNPERLDFIDSQLLVIGLAKRVGGYQKLLSYEVEGQVAKHSGIQQHWELNALGTLRWEPFWWDRFLDTSTAFGLGASFASEKPRAEILNEGGSQQWMLYWMLELSLALPQKPNLALISRIHHRSEGYGLVADQGGSNALAFGLKYRF